MGEEGGAHESAAGGCSVLGSELYLGQRHHLMILDASGSRS